MHTHPPHEAAALINALGAARRPFLFIFDYALSAIVVEPLDTLDASRLRYDVRGVHNTPPHEVPPALPLPIEWQATPPHAEAYRRGFERVRQGLLRGDSFLCNLTARLPLRTNLTLEQLFAHTTAPYRLWWRERWVCFSPEPFVRITSQGEISTFPMKGTIDATLPNAQQHLLDDVKEQAEHATIVDLLRNDLSQVASDVHVQRYRYVERIEVQGGALFQTSSQIVGQLPTNWQHQLGNTLLRLLPAGSITGAPKPMTQRIIAQAEDYDRGYYTGVFGLYDGQTLDSAVMIRFVEQQPDGSLCFKAGGGITAQSQWRDEYEEIKHKAHVPIPRNPLH